MKIYTTFDVYAYQVTAYGPNSAIKIEGKIHDSATGSTTFFVQVHDAQTTPAEASVPLKSWPVVAGQEFSKLFSHGELVFNKGLYICVSSTEATKTLGTGSNKFSSVSAELYDADPGLTAVGDNSTAVQLLQVWAEADGPKRLYQIDATISAVANNRYLKLFAKDTPSVGDLPILEWRLHGTSGPTNIHVNFGKGGRDVFSLDSNGTRRVGCNLVKESTSGAYTGTSGNGTFTIRATYKAAP